jgi:hypothetical protein
MSTTQNNPQPSGTSSNGDGGDGSKIRKFEAAVIVLVGIIGGFTAATGRRIMDHVSYFEAIYTGCLAAVGLCGFIILMLRFIRGQS